MKTYKKWIDKNVSKMYGETVILTGADGSIGYYITYYLAYLGATIVMTVNDVNKANKLKDQILREFKDAKIFIEHIDLFNIDSIKNTAEVLKKYNPKYLINNAGVYHLPPLKNKEGLERTFCINFFGPYLLSKDLLPIIVKNNGKIINQCSVSIKWVNLKKMDFSDFNSENTKLLTQKYAKSKVMMLFDCLKLKKEGIRCEIVHPGASATSLFAPFRGGFSKHFARAIFPLMKFFFMSPSKACLSTLYAIDHNTNYGEWIGPRGLFKVWGYPKIAKLEKKFLNDELINSFFNYLKKLEKDFI
jgi:NAD(P)-dependent dehydrogenase (short-subunit alcohol dehydrogenase family)